MCGLAALGFLPEMPAPSVTAAVTGSLELIATEQPQLLEFQLEMLLNSPARDIVLGLAKDLAVPYDRLGVVLIKACKDLGRLEKQQTTWRDPAKCLQSPNVAALLLICHARKVRVVPLGRLSRLKAIGRRLERAYEVARCRAWIEDFIGSSR